MSDYKPAGRKLNPLASFSRRGRIGLWVALAIFSIGMPVIVTQVAPTYSAEAVFEVFPRYQKTLRGDQDRELQSNSQYREFVNHLSQSLRRYDLIEAAVDKLEAAKVPVCKGDPTKRRCIERLQKVIVVLPVPDTYMMRVLLNSGTKKDLDTILNAIMDQFVVTVRDEQVYGSDERIQSLVRERERIQAEVVELEQKRALLAGELGLTSFGDGNTNPYDSVLAKLRERLVEVSIERSYAESTFNAFMNQKESSTRETTSVVDLTKTDAGLQALRASIVVRIEELNRVMSGLKPSHPVYKASLEERDTLQKRLNDREMVADKSARENLRARLSATLELTTSVEKELRKNIDEISLKAADYAKSFRQAGAITDALKKRADELNEIRDRIATLGLETDAIGWVRIVQRAMSPSMGKGIGKAPLLMILTLVCVLVSLIIPMLLDMLDRRILTVGDAEKAMGIQAAGWLVDVTDEPSKLLAIEQCRRLASTLLRNKARSGSSVFAFTPVNLGGEATEVILNIAKTLQVLGSRVLVVDANPMRIKMHMDMMGSCLQDVLLGKVDPMMAVGDLSYDGANFNVVPMGVQSTGLQRLDRLNEAFTVWSKNFDMILVDIPPLMHSADSELLIDIIRQVFLVVEVGEVTRSDVVQARQQLKRLDPEAIGLIVNRLPMESLGGDMRKQVAESITRRPFAEIMSISNMQLQYQVTMFRLQKKYMDWKERHGWLGKRVTDASKLMTPSLGKAETLVKNLSGTKTQKSALDFVSRASKKTTKFFAGVFSGINAWCDKNRF